MPFVLQPSGHCRSRVLVHNKSPFATQPLRA
jgi:hypothetical protein